MSREKLSSNERKELCKLQRKLSGLCLVAENRCTKAHELYMTCRDKLQRLYNKLAGGGTDALPRLPEELTRRKRRNFNQLRRETIAASGRKRGCGAWLRKVVGVRDIVGDSILLNTTLTPTEKKRLATVLAAAKQHK